VVYNSLPTTIDGLCRINGSVGPIFPIHNARVEYSVLKDGYSANFTVFEDVALTDAFGDWVIFVPQNKNCQIVIPETRDRKVFLAPTITASAYDDLTPLQTPAVTDRFGNVV
jgi:hypothetical protein